MKKQVVRFCSLLVFNIVVLLIIGWLTPARVGWAALWAAIVMTVLVIWVKPLVVKLFAGMTAKSADTRTKAGEALTRGFLSIVVAFVVWIVTVLLSRVHVTGWFWGYVLPPIILLIGWAVYALIEARVEAKAGEIYDKAATGITGKTPDAGTPSEPARRDLHDGLTDEQRKMLDDLG